MALRKIEYEEIIKVAEGLREKEGKFPSVESVRKASGYGMSKVYEAVTKWRNEIIAWEVLGERIRRLESENERLKRIIRETKNNKK